MGTENFFKIFDVTIDDNLYIPDGRDIQMRIDTDLIPICPDDGQYMVPNLRSDNTFVENEGWHNAARRYGDFLAEHGIKAQGFFTGDRKATINQNYSGKVLFLELGVGGNTPGIIKYPFWQMTYENKNATYACINMGEAIAPREIHERSICINTNIYDLLKILNL